MSEVKKYRKKPVVVEAMQYTDNESATQIIDWVLAGGGTARYVCSQPDSGPCKPSMPHHLAIDTLEGSMKGDVGDYIIKGVNGEFYPCKPDIFAKTYEASL